MDQQAPAVIVLRPGDRCLITLTTDPGEEEVIQYLDGLTKSFPGVQFVVMGGVAGMGILAGLNDSKETR